MGAPIKLSLIKLQMLPLALRVHFFLPILAGDSHGRHVRFLSDKDYDVMPSG